MTGLTEREELELAVEAACALGAEAAPEPPEPSGYVCEVPRWLHDAVDTALPRHLGYGYVEGVLVQRGSETYGGYRLATEDERARNVLTGIYVGLDKILPVVARARVRRLLSEAR